MIDSGWDGRVSETGWHRRAAVGVADRDGLNLLPVVFSITARPGPSLTMTFRGPAPLKLLVACSVLEMNFVCRMMAGLVDDHACADEM